MNAEIISIGTELLLGEITDTNATHIARELRNIGVNLYYTGSVGDNLERITNVLQYGLSRSDLIITTGGLGPTVDDMTRQAVAAATGRTLVFHQHLLDQIAERFRKFASPMTENNRQQAMIPDGAIIVENPVGTAPCFIVESEQGTIISLPGVPREMKYLLEHTVLPYLRVKMGLPAIIKARVLHTTGIGESSLDDKIGAYMTQANPTVGLAAHSGQTDIRITARAETEAEADAMIAQIETQIRQLVGQYVYGVDKENLDEIVLAGLKEHAAQVAIIEVGTGGVIAARLRRSENGAASLRFAEQYPDLSQLRREFEGENLSLIDLANKIVEAVRERQRVQIAIAILNEGEKTALAASTPERSWSREMQMGSNVDLDHWAGNWGLGYIWRYLNRISD